MSESLGIALIYGLAVIVASWNLRVAIIEFGEWFARAHGWK